MTTTEEMLFASAIQTLPLRERVGLVVNMTSASAALQAISEAEQAGVRQVWATQGPAATDALTVFTVAATRTTSIRMGTSILPTYPRHPLAVAAQARTFNELAPGRLRLGLGASHRPTIEGVYGFEMTAPLAHLREYVAVLRAALWEGKVEHHGRFFNVNVNLPGTARVPLLVAALGDNAFQGAGEFADGALSWNCPVSYLLDKAFPALHRGARQTQRTAPPIVAHVPVALDTDRQAVISAAQKRLGMYGKLPFYRNMFAEAGYPVPDDGTPPDTLIDNLVVSGSEEAIASHLKELFDRGLDEVLLLSIPIKDEAQEWSRLAHLIGQL